MDIDGSVPMTMMAYHALRMIHSAFIVISLCVQKNITFIYVLMLSLLDYDRKGDMIRVSLATVSICNGPLYIREYSSHQAPVHSLAEEGYERARNSGLLKCVMIFRGRIWWLTPKETDH